MVELVVLGGVGVVAAGAYLGRRCNLKEGDNDIAKERNQELQKATKAWEPPQISHLLHPHHQLTLVTGGAYVCNACWKEGPAGGKHYRCNACDFDLHLACANSDTSLTDTPNLRTFAHSHPVTLVKAVQTPVFTCSHCNNKGASLYRYQCKDHCYEMMHLTCARFPTMITSFLHPNHRLDLKTRHCFQKCAVCHHSGVYNARVYTCENCDFFVHPECAQISQYLMNHPLHPDKNGQRHTLVYLEHPKKQKTKCNACGSKCKYWSYTCYACEGVHFHKHCLVNYYSSARKGVNSAKANAHMEGFLAEAMLVANDVHDAKSIISSIQEVVSALSDVSL